MSGSFNSPALAGRGGGAWMREVQELLRRLGLTERYVGFFYTACAVELCMDLARSAISSCSPE